MNRSQLEARVASLLEDARESAPPAFIAVAAALVASYGNELDREHFPGLLSCYSREDHVKAVAVLESLPKDTESVKVAVMAGLDFLNSHLRGVSVSE